MRLRLLLILMLCCIGLTAQETPPSFGPNFKQLSTTTQYIQLPDSIIWEFKGSVYGWHRMGKMKQINGKQDTLTIDSGSVYGRYSANRGNPQKLSLGAGYFMDGSTLNSGSFNNSYVFRGGVYVINNPKGGTYSTTTFTNPLNGAIRITLPRAVYSDAVMINIQGTIWNYNRTLSFSINCYPAAWGNPSPSHAVIISNGIVTSTLPVRFNSDGTDRFIYIGDITSSFPYLRVSIDKVLAGHEVVASKLASGWSVGFETSAFSGTNALTLSNTFPNSNLQQPLNGYAVGSNTAIAATDTKLEAFGKLQGQINAREATITTLPVSKGGTGKGTITSGALQKGNGTGILADAIAGTDYATPAAVALKENSSNKQNSLATDGTGIKFPTVDAINTLNASLVHLAGTETISGSKTFSSGLTSGGTIFNQTYSNPSSINNSQLNLSSTGTVISDNTATANNTLVVNKANGSASGNILALQFGGVNKFAVNTLGNVIANNIDGATITGTTVKTLTGLGTQFMKADGTLDNNTYTTITDVANYANSLTITDMSATPYTKATLNSTYPSAPVRYEVVCPNQGMVYRKYDATNWYATTVTYMP